MPEGHTIHRLARLHRRDLRDRTVAVTSPQGRFAAGAARLDGGTVEDVTAAGKHLFHRWDDGQVLHVHLGLFGTFRTFTTDPPPATPGTRLELVTDDGVTIRLAGPTVCELITDEEEQAIRHRLGPDPLADAAGAAAGFTHNLGRRSIPIGAALLDQGVVAGIGNVYRAELLFLEGIHPAVPARELAASVTTALWERSVTEMRRGERSGRIVTTDPADFGERRDRNLDRDDRLWVYGRHGHPCRRCGTPIVVGEIAARSIWWCPTCQARDDQS